MNELELATHMKSLVAAAETHATEVNKTDSRIFREYLRELYGTEEANRSKYVSSDIMDVVEADMPALARIFLGSQEVMEFQPVGSTEQAELEAKEKTQYINWLVRHQPDSFLTLLDWLKTSELATLSTIKFRYLEEKDTETREWAGLDEEELTELVTDLESQDHTETVDIVSKDVQKGNNEPGTRYNVTLRVKRVRKRYAVEFIENFLISKNAKSVDKAVLIGDWSLVERGELVKQGFSKEQVKKIPRAGSDHTNTVTAVKDRTVGAESNEWATEQVRFYNLYPRVDYDDDGIAERRHIQMAGSEILSNKPYGIAPYACLTGLRIPNRVEGKSRGWVVSPNQRAKTVTSRGILDNLAQVNRPRIGVNANVNIDDVMVHRANGVIRSKGTNPVGQDLVPVITPYVGDKALQVTQYLDAARAQTTGTQLASQGLDADSINKETATRFNGVEESGAAKLELIARQHAETGFRQLYEGMAWLVSRYQDTETEIMVLGEPLTVDPTKWRFDHMLMSNVGLGAGDEETVMDNMASLLQITQQLQEQGSPLTDAKKKYNILSRVVKNMGLARVSDFFNDPEVPEEMAQYWAENGPQMMQLLQQIDQQPQNPLAEAEQVKASAALQGKLADLQVKMTQFEDELAQKDRHHTQEMIRDFTKLEAETGVDVPGSAIGADFVFDPQSGAIRARAG